MRAAVAFVLLAGSSLAAAGESVTPASSDDLSNIIDGGTVDLSFRYRFEFVDDDAFLQDAEASTIRSRVALQSGSYRNFDAFVEIDDVRELLADNFNAGQGNTPSRGEYPVVADPEGTEINQAYIDYLGFEGTRIRVGRQRINLDNQRFVGGVGWRQNEQTYDGLTINYVADGLTATYAYISKVRRIFGEDVAAGKHEQDGTHLLNISFDATNIGKFAGYYYRVDNKDAAIFSTATVGMRFTGDQELTPDTKLRYTAEFANQSDFSDNPLNIDAQYWNLEAGLAYKAYVLSTGWEVLSGDADSAQNESFRTPFATLHAFNGWADKFLGTPSAGLDDKYVKLKWSASGIVAEAVMHFFDTEDGGRDLGSELDVHLGYKVNKRLRGDVFLANFNGKNGFSDTQTIWFQLLLTL